MFQNVTMTIFFPNNFCSSTMFWRNTGWDFLLFDREVLVGVSAGVASYPSWRFGSTLYILFLRYTNDRIHSWTNTCILVLKNTKGRVKRYSIYRSRNNLIKIRGYVGFSRKLWKSFHNFEWNTVYLFWILNLLWRETFAYRAEFVCLGKLYSDLKF